MRPPAHERPLPPSVSAWMSCPVHTVAPATPAGDAVLRLRRHGIRHLPVLDGDRVAGVVTDRDLRGVAPDARVETVMSRPVTVVSPRTPIDRAASLLFDRRIGCLPVLEDGRLVGILTQTDALGALVAVLRTRVGGRRVELSVAFQPDAIAAAHQALRALGPEIVRLVAATREPFGPGRPPTRLRLAVETREPERVQAALRAAGLAVLAGEPAPDAPEA